MLFLSLAGMLQAQTKGTVGIGVGQWQPNQLETETPGSVFAGTADSTPFYSLYFSRYLFGDISLRITLGYWAHLFDRDENPRTVHITPIEFGLEQNLIKDSSISPYVVYGGSALLVNTEQGDHLKSFSAFKTEKIGFEIYLIAGIQGALSSHIGADLNFGYVVANLPESLGVGKDYSGARVSFGMFYKY